MCYSCKILRFFPWHKYQTLHNIEENLFILYYFLRIHGKIKERKGGKEVKERKKGKVEKDKERREEGRKGGTNKLWIIWDLTMSCSMHTSS